MSFGISAAVIGGGLAAAGAVGGALIGAQGARDAAETAANASKDANALQKYMYDQTREDQTPYRNAGYNALNALMQGTGTLDADAYARERFLRDWEAQNPDMPPPAWDDANVQAQVANYKASLPALYGQSGDLTRNFTAQDFQTDPGYAFRLAEGMKGIENSAAARGGLLSGAALKAAGQFNQNFASNEYQNAFNRFETQRNGKFNRLASLAGVGQTSTNATQQAGQNYANQAGNNLITAGNAAAAGTQRASGYIGQGIGFAANQLSNNWGNYGANNPYGTYSAQSAPVNDYYAGTQPYATLS
ncbi:hypothetical protein [Cupriavidus taiwanensis]|uniref:hypothetical protein n=1 Tax=Cupriavidus taiwanensis TaxID=164546 RepID=UPI000E1A3E54|nr:hypothetical protein [Cupriavidus taiwanensis]SPA44601.1 conserved exported hypothetical protein [Cupriavidus taiwanensis]